METNRMIEKIYFIQFFLVWPHKILDAIKQPI